MGKNRDAADQLAIIYEDEWLIVVEKPAGMLSMSTGRQNEVTAYAMLTAYVGNRNNKGIFIVHRLDKDTSGLLIFAKDIETKLSLQENWNEAVQERKYTAVLEGNIPDQEGWIESWLYENPKSMKVHSYVLRQNDNPDRPPRKDWQYASTHCKTTGHAIIEGKEYTIVEFDLETGRKNQIRVHSEFIGHPIAGDKKYGAQSNPFGRLALHACGLSFIHPWTGKILKFKSNLPKQIRKFF